WQREPGMGATASSALVSGHRARGAVAAGSFRRHVAEMTARQRPLATPEEIAVRAGQQGIPRLLLPARPDIFPARETRLRELAAAHPMRDFLLFTAELVRAQHQVLADFPAVSLPDAAALRAAAQAGKPPLPAQLWPRDPQWRIGLRGIVDRALAWLAPGQAADAVRAVG